MFGENIYCPEDRQRDWFYFYVNRVYRSVRKDKYPSQRVEVVHRKHIKGQEQCVKIPDIPKSE